MRSCLPITSNPFGAPAPRTRPSLQLAMPAHCPAATDGPSTPRHHQLLGQNRLVLLQAGPQSFSCWPVLSKKLFLTGVACFSHLFSPSREEMSHPLLRSFSNPLPVGFVWLPGAAEPLRDAPGGANRAAFPPRAGRAAARVLVPSAPSTSGFVARGFPQGRLPPQLPFARPPAR